ncbi:MAG: c-type cytochrome [Blastocatellia bacterium]
MNPRGTKRALVAFSAGLLLVGGMQGRSTITADAMFQDAKMLYMQSCAACHSADGSGVTAKGKELKVRDLRSAEVQKQTDAQLTNIIGKGKGKMPGYNSLGADKVKSLVGYLRELAKKK